jgi:hypothetical protein
VSEFRGFLIRTDFRGYLRNRTGPEWGATDLREGTPLGDLFDALLNLAIEFPKDVLPLDDAGRRRGPWWQDDSLFKDLAKAFRQWPGKKLKSVCRLMCEHPSMFPKYKSVKPDALYNRAKKRLAIETRSKASEKEEPPAEEPPALPNEDMKILFIKFLTHWIQEVVLRAEARRAKKKITFASPPDTAYYLLLDELLAGLSRREITLFPEEGESSEGK